MADLLNDGRSGTMGFKTAENWLDGEIVSKGEQIRRQNAKHRAEHPEVLKMAAERGRAPYDASHFYWQPVGGRNVVPKPRYEVGGNSRGIAIAKANQSNVDVVVFGHEQDAQKSGQPGHTADRAKFDLSTEDWIGHKPRIGHLDANHSQVDTILFGSDTDGGYDLTAIEAEMVELRQFKNAAGVTTSKTAPNKPDKIHHGAGHTTKYAMLKNASAVDQVVFGHETGGDADASGGLYEDDPSFADASGVGSTALNLDRFVEGRKIKRMTAIQKNEASEGRRPSKTQQYAAHRSAPHPATPPLTPPRHPSRPAGTSRGPSTSTRRGTRPHTPRSPQTRGASAVASRATRRTTPSTC